MATQDHQPAETAVELEFRVRDRDLFFVRASGRGARVALAEMVQRSDGRLLEYFTVEGVSPDPVRAAAERAPGIDDARLVRRVEGHHLFEFVVAGPCVGATLADAGAVVREAVAEDGVGRVLADVPPHADAGRVVETVRARHDAELLARRERDRPAPEFTRQAFCVRLADRLTDRQLEVLRTAYAGGYFTWPRESTAEECAEALGVTQPTFTQHLRASERKVLGALLEDLPGGDDPRLYR